VGKNLPGRVTIAVMSVERKPRLSIKHVPYVARSLLQQAGSLYALMNAGNN
jgi:hypothetical protein